MEYILLPDGECSEDELGESDCDVDDPDYSPGNDDSADHDLPSAHVEVRIADQADPVPQSDEQEVSGQRGEESQLKRRKLGSSKNRSRLWKRGPFQIAPEETEWKGETPEALEEINDPLSYFLMFFDENMIQQIVDETNKYALQKFGKELKASVSEFKRYLAILVYTGIYKAPSFRLFWKNETRVGLVADLLSRNRFEEIHRCLHLVDNSNIRKKGEPGYDKLFKIRPVMESLRQNLLNTRVSTSRSFHSRVGAP
jgi:hypothetical protein